MPLNNVVNLGIQTIPGSASGSGQISGHSEAVVSGGVGNNRRALQLSKITDRATGYKEGVRVRG